MKKCETCRYGNEYELDKPCIVYREDCPLYQKEGEEMTSKDAKSCIKTIEMLRRLAYNIHGVMDVIDADNCEKIIKALEQEPKTVRGLHLSQQFKDWQFIQEPKTGFWCGYDKNDITLRNWWDINTCSICGNGGKHYNKFRYCPNCGAKMESDHKCHTCKHYTSGEYDGSCDSYICEGYSDWESEVRNDRDMEKHTRV